MRSSVVLLIGLLAASVANGDPVYDKAVKEGAFLIWVGDKPHATAPPELLGDVTISGPWHGGRHVHWGTVKGADAAWALSEARRRWGDMNRPGKGDALDELNAQRAARGLRPYVRDEGLSKAAIDAATHRAANRISGHTPNDFAFLPRGSHAPAAGCAAWPQGMGFGSCCCYDDYTYAGAAYAIGSDGLRYMHLFVR